MDARNYWNSYVDRHDGPSPVAARLDTPYSTIAGICNGNRGIGRTLARRFAERDPELDENILVWVRPVKSRSAKPASRPEAH